MLDFDPVSIIFTVVNLLVLFVVLKQVLFKRVTKIIEDRAALIHSDLDAAKRQNDEAGALKTEYEAQLAEARAKAAEIIAQAKAQGQREYDIALDAARSDAQTLLSEARAQIAAEREAMLRGARGEVAQLALLAAAKVSGKALDGADDRALVNVFLEEAGESL